jgi:hypothetical protein
MRARHGLDSSYTRCSQDLQLSIKTKTIPSPTLSTPSAGMLFNSRYLIYGLTIATFSSALPLEGASKPRSLVRRAKSYSVVNVDGGSTASPEATTTVFQPTTATATVTLQKSSSSSTSTSAPDSEHPPSEAHPTPTPTPEPSVVTVIITETASPTKFYDDGMWHTSYAVKTFEEVAPTPATSSIHCAPSVECSWPQSYNQTGDLRHR